MGLLMEKELKYLVDELANPARPFLVILGGSKVSSKITVIKSLMEKADTIIIGGAMAYTFFLAQGIKVGKSLVEPDKVGSGEGNPRAREGEGRQVPAPGRYAGSRCREARRDHSRHPAADAGDTA